MRKSLALVGVAVVLSLVLGYALGVSAQERPVRILVNGKEIQCDPPAFIKEGRTFVPVRFVSEALRASVDWDADNYAVLISTRWPTTPLRDLAGFIVGLESVMKLDDSIQDRFSGTELQQALDHEIRFCEGFVEKCLPRSPSDLETTARRYLVETLVLRRELLSAMKNQAPDEVLQYLRSRKEAVYTQFKLARKELGLD